MLLTIDQAGRIEYIAGHGLELSDQGQVTTRRASHVEPVNVLARVAFHVVRAVCSDNSQLAAWTRTWGCVWRVRVLGGPVLAAGWRDREAAIAAEVAWLEQNRFGG
jgi:hypothetical protein